ncbi:MAG: YihY/virulence factor BrkB family protein [Actinomycetia bacterium]|nr:YihY/virulence factor BrkB family protein [Actinomycetes bacterium]
MLETLKHRLDAFQQNKPILAFPVSVARKFGDDKGGYSAAIVAYYSFFAIFPLLLVMVTVVGLVLRTNEGLQQRFVDSALAQFPVVGRQLGENVGGLHATGLALAIGIAGTLLGARGMAAAMQETANNVWNVPLARRPGFPQSQLRNLGLLLVVGVGLVGATLVPATVLGTTSSNPVSQALSAVASVVLYIAVFLLAFRLATAPDATTGSLIFGAIVAAVGWEVLQLAGTLIVQRYISQANDVYGIFAVVIGLISWLYLAAMMTVYAMEVSVVRARRLWPRSIFSPPLTDADEQAYRDLVKVQQRVEGQDIDVTFEDPEAAGLLAHKSDPSAPD